MVQLGADTCCRIARGCPITWVERLATTALVHLRRADGCYDCLLNGGTGSHGRTVKQVLLTRRRRPVLVLPLVTQVFPFCRVCIVDEPAPLLYSRRPSTSCF